MGLNLFNKKIEIQKSFAGFYEVDFHSHIIPGVDDGSRSVEESIEIITFFKSIGLRKMITTPHISTDYHQNKQVDIMEQFRILKDGVIKAGIDIELEVAAEYMIDDGFRDLIDKGNLLTFGNNYLLIELSSFTQHPDFFNLIFDLQRLGPQKHV